MRPLIANLGPTELFIILGILVLLFGATKLPELVPRLLTFALSGDAPGGVR